MKNKRTLSIHKIEDLFEAKERFHKELAKISFEEKIDILIRLQEIANNIRGDSDKKEMTWKISVISQDEKD